MKIADTYLAEFGSFGDGKPNKLMFDRIDRIVNQMYGAILQADSEQHLLVDDSVAWRARDVVLANLEQYKLLLFVEKDDGRHWNVIPGGQMKFSSSGPLPVAQSNCVMSKPEKPNRRTNNLLTKSNPLKVNILLHNSIVFVKTGLYVDWRLKMASSIIDKSLLSELVTEGLLIAIPDGIIGKWNKPTVYIKTVPGGLVCCEDVERMIALYADDRLTMDTYLDKCTIVKLEGFGRVSQTVFDVLDRPEYKELNLDLSALIALKPSEYSVCSLLCMMECVLGDKMPKKQALGVFVHRPRIVIGSELF